MTFRDEVLTKYSPEWDTPLTDEQLAGYVSVTRSWDRRTRDQIDETLEVLYKSENIIPDYLVLNREDAKYLHYIIISGTNICLRSDFWPWERMKKRLWYMNFTVGHVFFFVVDDTLPPSTLKFLYKTRKVT